MQLYSDRITALTGIGFPANTKPTINPRHIDGPLLTFSDGQMHWLGFFERIQFALGLTDAEKLQRKLRPNLTRILDRAKVKP